MCDTRNETNKTCKRCLSCFRLGISGYSFLVSIRYHMYKGLFKKYSYIFWDSPYFRQIRRPGRGAAYQLVNPHTKIEIKPDIFQHSLKNHAYRQTNRKNTNTSSLKSYPHSIHKLSTSLSPTLQNAIINMRFIH